MKMWILRHGQAEPSAASDAERRLTDTGREEVTDMAGLLAGHGLEAIIASPYRRAQQTAELMRRELGFRRSIITVDWLTPDSDPLAALDELADRVEGEVLLVSHQPLVGQLLSLLVDGHRQRHYPMPTAGLACLEMPLPAAGVADLVSLANPASVRERS
ncbi:phosphohistidine phosphatase SixA [Pseudomonas sp. G11-1]|uniref:Phosphohistidine phosphatase SixA n=1 Tax=Halopseudomonas bauzanensis TaxID=653930 RepID=A0A4U0YRH1_9GAMM|nr:MULTISPECIES: phosphohistidine phosphatase SixA [Halopseudomonas]MCO5784740.1 phosphohistidine phosphatase SixA [Pseudomonas sp. G11-1]MCO5789157.1 phosphohistidine phosphatase SixA [Pseudomonas sp. G11-2]EZQ19913.1 phosphohistidine phosphatase [Halopseudomonas bauzanensis]TKA91653.1 phosphohistidine phosphatase SixA [Halopseudomonas bauzanensis]WGK60307.1 phosphohistidine phosphatase SixA [Halopseudomonas sp. SMJS2]